MRKLLLVFALLAVPFALFIGCNMRSNPTAASAVKAADVTPVATCVLYSDNFSANTLGNYNYFCTTTQGVKTAANVGYTITGGTLENIGPGGVAVLNSPFFNPANTSYTVEANFELNSTQNNRGIFGLAFEAGVNYSFYSFQWSYDGSASGGTPDWELEKNNGAPNTGAYLDETTGLPYILGSTVHLKVVVNGNNFKCYANFNDGAGDRLFFNDIDTNAPLTDGSVGLRTYGITNPMVAKINNFTVSSCSPVLTATPGGPTSTPTVVCGGSSGGSGPICPNSYLNWTILAPMPTGRQELAAGVDNGILYAVGGYGNSGILNTVEAYDPATNSWSTKVPMPTARQGLAVGVVNGILYALGGIGIAHGGGSGSVYLNTVEAYNPATNSWSTMAPMPTARYGLSVAVMNGILYAVGGWNFSSGLLNTVETYDPATNSWSTKAFMPTARSNTAAGVLDGILYVAGGSSSSLEAYNPCTNSWTTGLPGLPTPMGYPAGGVMNGQFYLADGVTVEFYNPSTNSWTSQATNPTARQSLAGGVINNVFYLVGGWSGNNLATNEGGALVCGFTPTPTVTPTPTCAYSDNFSADTLGNYNYSSTTDPSANTAASVGFVLAGGTLENTGFGGLAVLGSTSFNTALTSYTLQADFELNATQNNLGLFGLVFEAGTDHSFYSFQWSYGGSASGGTPDWELEKNNGTPNTGASYLANAATPAYTLGSTARLKVVVNGNNFLCYANFNDGVGDRQIFNVTDTESPYTGGSVGVRTYGITDPMVVNINNFAVNGCP